MYQINDQVMQNDEYLWMQRGLSYVRSFASLDLKDAIISAHPGIVPSILIGTSMILFAKDFSVHSIQIFDPTFAARLPIVIIGSITPVLTFVLLRRIISEKVAFIASLFIALDPIHIAYSRIAHLDSTLTLFFTITIITYFIGEQNNKIYWKYLSGIFFGLTILTKLTGFLILPILFIYKLLILLSKDTFKSVRIRTIFSIHDILPLIIGIAIYVALYPKMWENPLSFFSYNTQIVSNFVESSHETGNFWAGRAVADPPWCYYIVLLFIQSNELLLISFIGGSFFLFKSILNNKNDQYNFYILTFCVLIVFIGALSVSGKKIGVRYILPIWPFLGIIGAYGILELIKKVISVFKIKFKSEKVSSFVVVSIIIAFLLSTDLSYSPHYYNYFNSLIGGPDGAKNYVAIEGQSSAPINYIKSIAGYNKTIAVVGPDQLVRYYYGGKITNNGLITGENGIIGRATSFFESINWRTADYLVIYLRYKQADPEYSAVKWTESQVPLFTEIRNGAEMSWVYKIPESLKNLSYFEDFSTNKWEKDKYLSYGLKTSNRALVPYRSNESVYLIYLFKFNNSTDDIYLNVTGINRYTENSITVLVSNDGVDYKNLIEFERASLKNVIKSSNIAKYIRDGYIWVKFEMYFDKRTHGPPFILDFSINNPSNNSKILPVNESYYKKPGNYYQDDFINNHRWKEDAYSIHGIAWSDKVDNDGGVLYPEYKDEITKIKYKFKIDSKKNDYKVKLKVTGTMRDLKHNISVMASIDNIVYYKVIEFNSTSRQSSEADITNYVYNNTVWIEFRLYGNSEGDNVPRINDFYIESLDKNNSIYPLHANSMTFNVIKEHSFENYQNDNSPISWSFTSDNGAQAGIDTSASSGNNSFRTTVRNATSGNADLSQLFAINGSRYLFNLSYKQTGSGNASALLQWMDAQGKEIRKDQLDLYPSMSWNIFSFEKYILTNTTQGKVTLRYQTQKGDSGIVWFDDVQLYSARED